MLMMEPPRFPQQTFLINPAARLIVLNLEMELIFLDALFGTIFVAFTAPSTLYISLSPFISLSFSYTHQAYIFVVPVPFISHQPLLDTVFLIQFCHQQLKRWLINNNSMENYPMLFPCGSSSSFAIPASGSSSSYLGFSNFGGQSSSGISLLGLRPSSTDDESGGVLKQKKGEGESDNVEEVGGSTGKKKGEKKVRKPRYAFQTRSQVDILDDGYRWRKYGQKAVKNNKFPRYLPSYAYFNSLYQFLLLALTLTPTKFNLSFNIFIYIYIVDIFCMYKLKEYNLGGFLVSYGGYVSRVFFLFDVPLLNSSHIYTPAWVKSKRESTYKCVHICAHAIKYFDHIS